MLCKGTLQRGCQLIGNSMLYQNAFRPNGMLCLGIRVKQSWASWVNKLSAYE